MKKSRFFEIGFALLSLLLLFSFGFMSCSSSLDDDDDDDSEPNIVVVLPSDVTNLTANASGTRVLLSWTDAADSDIFGYEVSYSQRYYSSSARAVLSPMNKNSIFVAPGAGGAVVSNLSIGTTYTFTVKTMDTSGYKSDGVTSESVKITENSPLSITLAPSTTEPTNKDVTVSVEVSSSDDVSEIAYVKGLSYKIDDVLENGYGITSAKSFTAAENGIFTVAAKDADGRREITWIEISNIDKTSPKAVLELAADYDRGEKKITLTWTTSDSDIDHYLVSYSVDGTAKATDESVSESSYSLENVEQGSGT